MNRQSNNCFPRVKLAQDRGVALIVVLWIFIFLFVVAFEFSTAAREEASGAHRFSDETQGYYLAVAAFERGLYDFLRQPTGGRAIQQGQPKTDPFDGEWREENLGAGAFRVRLVDEGGKININRVSEETLRRVFTNLGIDAVQRDVLVDSIMDWRDPDDLHRANGAENSYYASLAPAYTTKNGPLDSVAELLWIKGVTRDLLFGRSETTAPTPEKPRGAALRDIFTVDSPIDRVNLRTASAEVIHALTGIPLERCRAFADERKKLSDKTLEDLLPLLGIGARDATLQMFIFTNPSVVAVEAEGRVAKAGAPRRVKGVVRLGGAQGFELMRWLDRDTPLPES
ncbi:MAG: general secretion pathway protein GspK [Candidatus Binatia bacterium]